MNIDLFDYYLPEKLIAQKPSKPRDYARLLVMDRSTGECLDDYFFHLYDRLKAGDVLVFNNTKVIPARILFEHNGKKVEILLVKRLENGFWEAMVRPGKVFRVGQTVMIMGVKVSVEAITKDGLRVLSFALEDQEMSVFLEKVGKLPVPPYIAGENYHEEEYNTVFSHAGMSIAAPTAGLHFTDELLEKLKSKGIILEFVNLNVGLGTFLPVKTLDTRFHKMHEETYEIEYSTADRLNRYHREGRRIIAVGTTSVRVLEDNMTRFGKIVAGNFSTAIFIKPGYNWKIIGGLITNFHLPKSTLLMLVSAFVDTEKTLAAYRYAVSREYRFFSFGDAMLIL